MKSNGVDAWLKHWIKLQKKNKWLLVLKWPTDKTLGMPPSTAITLKSKKKGGKAWYIEPDDTGSEGLDECLDKGGKTKDGSVILNDGAENDRMEDHNGAIIPKSPYSASNNRKTQRKFLAMLSVDNNYKKLMLLLHVAKVSEYEFPTGPANYCTGR